MDKTCAKNLYLFALVIIILPASGCQSVMKNSLNDGDFNSCDVCPEMVDIPGGSFLMGSKATDQLREHDERLHRVNIKSFSIGRYEVTQAQWQKVMGEGPSNVNNCDQCPQEDVYWFEAQKYIAKLNKLSGQWYRLPTEAEWEYACRGGIEARYCGGNESDKVAWLWSNSSAKLHPVGLKAPNGFGLYDMSGNVWELTCSPYDQDYLGGETTCLPANYSGPRVDHGPNWVARGGSFSQDEDSLRAANRDDWVPMIANVALGLRLAKD